MASLRELQYAFAAALRDPAAACPVTPAAHLDIYRNNGAAQFRGVLEISFPVVRRRVGDDYFRQLAHHYRQQHPSRSGDLHWLGREFPSFLAAHLRGTEYAWLADLARLEWQCELAQVARESPALHAEALARHAPEELERLRFSLQPSLGLLRSDYPVFSIWCANQRDIASPVEQSLGAEQGMVRASDNGLTVHQLAPALFSYLTAVAAGSPLGAAMTAAELDEAGLLHALHFMFSERLVCEVSLAP